MTVTVTPFKDSGFGADISGVDLREPLGTEDRDAIRRAWLDHLVLRFRDQEMTDAQHMAFTRQFGELEFNPAKLIEKQYGVETQTSGRRGEIPPEISVISNILENGQADRRARRRRGVLAHGFVVCRCAAGREPAALSRMPAALFRRRNLFPQYVFGLRDLAFRYQDADRRDDCDPCRDAFERRQGA